MWHRIVGNIDLVLAAFLVILGLGFMVGRSQKLDATAVATLVGALFGGATLLLGNWISRSNERKRAAEAREQRCAKLKTLIAAELVNVAAGLIDAKDIVDAAFATIRAGGSVADRLDMNSYLPRDMPLTDCLGVELLILEQPAIDSLATLRSNLAITRMSMEEVTRGERFGLLRITALSNGIRHDMELLSEAFEHIAPTRKLELPDQQAELASVILRRMSTANLADTVA
jgi:hypothetical protein